VPQNRGALIDQIRALLAQQRFDSVVISITVATPEGNSKLKAL